MSPDSKNSETERKMVVDSYIFFSQTHRGLHKERRTYEWQIIFTVISLNLSIVLAFYSNKIDYSLNMVYNIIILIVISFLISILYFFTYKFLKYVHNRNHINMGIAEYFEDALNRSVNSNEDIAFKNISEIIEDNKNNNDYSVSKLWAFKLQHRIVFIIALLTIVLIAIRIFLPK